ncbi:MAG TPA: hypothetical protein VNL14_11660 [Candidatus Acidoferrales bacterium]|nr:hypothetical protein [Candidatus Acidoferrales bacterium]
MEQEKHHQRQEFRIVCQYKDGTELQLKTAPTLAEAIHVIEKLDPKLRNMCQWLVYEAVVTESLKIVYRDKTPEPVKPPLLRRLLSRIPSFRGH